MGGPFIRVTICSTFFIKVLVWLLELVYSGTVNTYKGPGAVALCRLGLIRLGYVRFC